jgi:tetratricopeptide (TPR) repeat protein
MKEDKKYHLIAIAFLSLFATALYFNSLNNTFIFDDFAMIVENPFIQHLEDIPLFLKGLTVFTNWYRALPTLTFAINYHFHGINTFGYHIVNLIIHILSGILVYLISRHLFGLVSTENQAFETRGKRGRKKIDLSALFTALIFVSHPVQVNTVTYIVQRYEGLSSFFYLLSFFLFIKMSLSQGTAKKSYFIGTGIIFLFVVFSKETGFTLPIILILFDLLFICRNWIAIKKRLMIYVGIFSPLLLFFFFLMRGGLFEILSREKHFWTPWQNLLTQSNVIIQYMKLLLLPLPQWLNIDHDFPLSKSLFQYPTFISVAVILCLLILAVILIKRNKLISFAIFFFFIFLAPTSTLIPIWDIMVEYRLYLPLLSYALILTLGLHYLHKVLASRYSPKISYTIIYGVSILILASYSLETIERNKIFSNELTLWSDALEKSPDKLRTKINAVSAFHRYGRHDEAIAVALEALKKDPHNPEMYNKLGISYMYKGEYDKAIEALRTSIQMDSDNAKPRNNLGVVYLAMKEFDQAIAEFKQALSINPRYAEAYNNLAKTLATKGSLDEAIEMQKEATRISPKMGEYHFNLAKMYEKKGWPDESIKEYKEALKVYPTFFEAYHFLGMLYTEVEKNKEAIQAFEEAIRLNPTDGTTSFMLGINYIKTGDRKKAIYHLQNALQYVSNEKERKGIESLLNKLRSVSR